MKFKIIVAFFTILFLVSCISEPVPVPTSLFIPTSTDLPSIPTITPKPTFTKTSLPTQTLTPVPTPTFAPVPPRRSKYDKISGTYKLDRGNSEVCVLKVVLEPLILPSQEISFELFCKHGPPLYKSGHVMAKITISDNVAVYSSPQPFWGSTCRIDFQFNKNMVEATQSGTEMACNFEQGIHADGVYNLIDAKPPVLGCMNDENPCGLLHPIP